MNNIITDARFTIANGKRIRFFTPNNEVLFAAIDIVRAVGDTISGPNTFAHVPDECLGVVSVETPFGDQHMITITVEGMNAYLSNNDSPDAQHLRRHLLNLPIPAKSA